MQIISSHSETFVTKLKDVTIGHRGRVDPKVICDFVFVSFF